jgi:putative flippase GtrA
MPAFGCLALLALVAIPTRTLDLATDLHGFALVTPGIALALATVGATRRWPGLALALRAAAAAADRHRAARIAIALAIIGSLLRIGWSAAFPVDPSSDAKTYLGLANRLLTSGIYETDGTRAYWPPGFPLFLTPVLALTGGAAWTVPAINVCLFLAAAGLLWQLGKRVAGEGLGALAIAIVALMPSLWMGAGVAQKEQLLIPLLLAIALATERVADATGSGRRVIIPCIGCGVLLGLGVLVQPSLQLFLAVIACRLLVSSVRPTGAVASVIAIAVVASATVLPWSLRNEAVLGQFVSVSTNGGSNLYRANNPLATGGYTASGAVSLEGLDELTKDRVGFALAREWITSNPGDFLRLAGWKQVLFLGDDSTGAFESLRRGDSRAPPAAYVLAKALSNAYWLAVWLVCTILLWARGGLTTWAPAPVLTATLGILYLFALHSVFESSGRYHLPVAGFLALVCASLLCGATGRDRASGTSATAALQATRLGRLVAFAGIGVAATALHYAILIALAEILDVDPRSGTAIGFGISAIANYIANQHLTFAGRASVATTLPRFVAVASIGLAINSLAFGALYRQGATPYLAAQVGATLAALAWNFCANEWWAFRRATTTGGDHATTEEKAR